MHNLVCPYSYYFLFVYEIICLRLHLQLLCQKNCRSIGICCEVTKNLSIIECFGRIKVSTAGLLQPTQVFGNCDSSSVYGVYEREDSYSDSASKHGQALALRRLWPMTFADGYRVRRLSMSCRMARRCAGVRVSQGLPLESSPPM